MRTVRGVRATARGKGLQCLRSVPDPEAGRREREAVAIRGEGHKVLSRRAVRVRGVRRVRKGGGGEAAQEKARIPVGFTNTDLG